MAPVQSAGGWPRKVKRRDGWLVTFDVTRIESAVARAAREVAHTEPRLPASVAAAVADASYVTRDLVNRGGEPAKIALGLLKLMR